MIKKLTITACLAILPSLATAAVDAKTQKAIQETIPNTKIFGAKESEIKGLYSVFTGNQIIYVEPKNKLLFIGRILDKGGFDVTSNEYMRAIDHYEPEIMASIKQTPQSEIKKLKEVAIQDDRGSRYALLTFTNPDCPNCVAADKFLKDKNISLYYMLVGNPNKIAMMLASQNPLLAYKENKTSAQAMTQEAQQRFMDMSTAASTKFFVTGTPTFYVIDQKENKIIERIVGANTAALQKWIDKNEAEKN